jgi:glycosyltransferase involved in cell wall biosynthesis
MLRRRIVSRLRPKIKKTITTGETLDSSFDDVQTLNKNVVCLKQPDDVTLLIKSFLRRECVDKLIKSIRERYPTIPIVVVDDSAKPGEKPWSFDYDENIKTYNLPFDSGLSAGRNHGVANIKTKYFVLLDDDFVFTDKTDLALMKSLLEEGDYDILGGAIREKSGLREYNFKWHWEEKTGILGREKVQPLQKNIQVVDCILNFFIAKSDRIRECPWDNSLKLSEHTAFFFDYRHKLLVAYTSQFEIFHAQKKTHAYNLMRNRAKEYVKKMKAKRGITEIKTLPKLSVTKTMVRKKSLSSKNALINLLALKEIFQKHEIEFWLADGTLLGAVRENNFIKHDTDTDLGVLFTSFKPEVLKDILKEGFRILKVFGAYEDGFELAVYRNGVKTDLFFYYCGGEKYPNKIYHSAYADFTKNDALKYDFVYDKFQVSEITFLDQKFPAPDNPLKFLETKYGSDWMKPKPNWSYYKDPKNAIKTNTRIKTKTSEEILEKILKDLK